LEEECRSILQEFFRRKRGAEEPGEIAGEG